MKIEITKTMALSLIPAVDGIANKMKDNVMSAMVADDIVAIKAANKNLIEVMELKKVLSDAAEGCEVIEPEKVKAEVIMLPEKPKYRTTFKSFQSGGMLVPAERGDGMVMVGGYRYEIKVEEAKGGVINIIVRLPDENKTATYKKKSIYDDLSMPISLFIARRGEKGRYSNADRKNACSIQMEVSKNVNGLLNR